MTLSRPRRVVVTGIGAITPIGNTAASSWANALEGKSGVGTITHFDPTECPVKIAAEVKNYDPTQEFSPLRPDPQGAEVTQAVTRKDLKKMGRFIHLSLGASVEAYVQSGLDMIRDRCPPERMGVNIGVGMGGLPEIEEVHTTFREKGFKRITPFFVPQVITNMAAGQLSILLNLKGPNLCSVSACASSAHAIGESFRHIQMGRADVMVAGGAEAVISPLGIGGFASMKALSDRNDDPQKASRPFDVNRDGFVMGEGAATIILEDLEFAEKRGAKIIAEIVGYGLSGDAYHMTSPAPEGEGGYRAMLAAVQSAGIRSEQIGYVNAHGTSTPAGDADEALAIARLLGDAAAEVHVSSTKSMTGHLLGGAGALEAAFAIFTLRDGKIPPTINLDNLDPNCEKTGMNFTPHRAVAKKIEYAMSNSFGFGGTNASVVFARYM